MVRKLISILCIAMLLVVTLTFITMADEEAEEDEDEEEFEIGMVDTGASGTSPVIDVIDGSLPDDNEEHELSIGDDNPEDDSNNPFHVDDSSQYGEPEWKNHSVESGSSSITVEASNDRVFVDVPDGAWYAEYVSSAFNYGIMRGVGENRFHPEEMMTRSMLVQILFNMENDTVTSYIKQFSDVPETAWFADAVSWAVQNRLIEGFSDELFFPDQVISRKEFIQVLYNYCKYKEYDVQLNNDLSEYKDVSHLSGLEKDAMCWAVTKGLISGIGDNRLDPDHGTTRAQASKVLVIFCEFYGNREKT